MYLELFKKTTYKLCMGMLKIDSLSFTSGNFKWGCEDLQEYI